MGGSQTGRKQTAFGTLGDKTVTFAKPGMRIVLLLPGLRPILGDSRDREEQECE